MFSFRVLRQIRVVIRFWIAALICFKWKKLCFVARFGNKKRVPNWELFFYGSEIKLAGS